MSIKSKIEISPDEKQASLMIVSDNDQNTNMQPSILLKALQNKGITKGIKKNILQSICTDKLYNKKYVVAKAVPPQKGENAHLKILVKPKERSRYDTGTDKEKKVNHYGERDGFITFVDKDDAIAERIPPTTGEPGFTVTGKPIEGITGEDLNWNNYRGRNTKVKKTKLVAAQGGILKKNENKFNIEQTITLEKDIGLKSGSIILPLDSDIELIIPGDIKRGFGVQCRNIKVMGTVEDARVKAHSLEIGRGIVGTSNLPIEADYINTGFITGTRKITAKFINVKREISGGSTIFADFVQSQIIQESSVTASYGVKAKYLYGKNKITVGVNFRENAEAQKWTKQLKGVENAIAEAKQKFSPLLKKYSSVKIMAEKNPKSAMIQNELKKISAVQTKIDNMEKIRKMLESQLNQHGRNMYIAGSPFILVELGFGKKTEKKVLNDLNIKDILFDKNQPQTHGLYTLVNEEVIVNKKFDLGELTALIENYKSAALNSLIEN